MAEQESPEASQGGGGLSSEAGRKGGSNGESKHLHGAEAPLGAALEPVLRACCENRLSSVGYFRTDWQRGGASTGYATFQDNGVSVPVVVKFPVPPVEMEWLRRLSDTPSVAPRLLASGAELGGYDLAWVVMERLPHGPLGPAWQGREFDLLVAAAGRFYAAASRFPVEGEAVHHDWDRVFEQARDNIHEHDLPHEQRWKETFKRVHRRMREWVAIWRDRPANDWCHGDMHPGNAMTRHAPPGGEAVLFDFAQTRRGCWVEDAVYFEHLFWSRRQRLNGRKLCKLIAQERKKLGLPVAPDWSRYASAYRALLAMSGPGLADLDGNPGHVQSCLEMLEMSLDQT